MLARQHRRVAKAAQHPISPLVGEMAGRPEGGAVPPAFQGFSAAWLNPAIARRPRLRPSAARRCACRLCRCRRCPA
ncbi:hypothetical protein FJ419_00065 [Mesorhizobium sp. B2-6-2]|nr:hypothetical protein FJ419_00065 [Mesorhizobium sp. B2-6-2]